MFRVPASRRARGDDERGTRYAVVVQADELLDLGRVLVPPTSTSARPATSRPSIELLGETSRVLVEQTTVVDPQRLGETAGRLGASKMSAADDALHLVLGL